MKVVDLRIQKIGPANMVWDRILIENKLAKAQALLKTHNQKNTHDALSVQDPHSA